MIQPTTDNGLRTLPRFDNYARILKIYVHSSLAYSGLLFKKNYNFGFCGRPCYGLKHPVLTLVSLPALSLVLRPAPSDRVPGFMILAKRNLRIVVFYLSKRTLIESLLRAAKRHVDIRLILDSNKDAFGREKNGIPNRQVASELIKKSENKIRIRWYDTHGEQYHSKFAYFHFKNRPSVVILGSANFTKRNLDDFNLELDVLLSASPENKTIVEVKQYYERIWNDDHFTVDYSKYEDNSFLKKLWYRFLEFSGFTTF